MNFQSKGRLLTYLAVIFVAGGVTGSVVMKSLNRRPPPGPPHTAEHIVGVIRKTLQEKLDLTPAQLEKITPRIQAAALEIKIAHGDSARRIGTISRELHAQIAPELTPEQREKLAQFDREREESVRRKCGPPGGGKKP